MGSEQEIRAKPFESASAWESWLSDNHRAGPGLWVMIAKKGSGIATVTYDEAVDVALCYGWIDGQRKSHDDDYFMQKFTPRRTKSLWSKRNISRVSKLADAARMQPAGLAEVEAAKQDGRWEAAYDAQRDMVVPEDFIEAIRGNEKAQASFEGLGKADLFAIGWRLQTVKTPAGRKQRIASMIKLLEQNKPISAARKPSS